MLTYEAAQRLRQRALEQKETLMVCVQRRPVAPADIAALIDAIEVNSVETRDREVIQRLVSEYESLVWIDF
jgi:hypothetical protein